MVGAMTARLTLADESALDRRSPAITTPMTPEISGSQDDRKPEPYS
jgi:hypothetical protein